MEEVTRVAATWGSAVDCADGGKQRKQVESRGVWDKGGGGGGCYPSSHSTVQSMLDRSGALLPSLGFVRQADQHYKMSSPDILHESPEDSMVMRSHAVSVLPPWTPSPIDMVFTATQLGLETASRAFARSQNTDTLAWYIFDGQAFGKADI